MAVYTDPPTQAPETASSDRSRPARLRSLGFSGGLGATIAGGAMKVIHEGAEKFSPRAAKHTGKLILPAALMGLGAGIGDKKEEMHRATSNIITRASQAAGAARGAGGGFTDMRKQNMPAGLGDKSASVPLPPMKLVPCTADEGQTLSRALFNNYPHFERQAEAQLPLLFRSAGEASTPLRPRYDMLGVAGEMPLSGLLPRTR